MKKADILFLFLFIITINYGQTKNVNYDSTLAKNFGADDFGMKSYVFVVLKTGKLIPKNFLVS